MNKRRLRTRTLLKKMSKGDAKDRMAGQGGA